MLVTNPAIYFSVFKNTLILYWKTNLKQRTNMKKIILSLGIAIAAVFATQAQVNEHAIGLRSGGGTAGYGFGNEISYQHGMGNSNRMELDLGFRGDGFGNYFSLAGIYHWVHNIEAGFNWFVGPGALLGSYSYSYTTWNGRRTSDSYLFLGLGGQIGIEYDFNEHNVPILLGFDIRPMLYLGDGLSEFIGDGALSIRYTF